MFDSHFEAFIADVPEARETHYRLRYQVYCVDTSWEDKDRFPDQMERDEFDERSTAFLVRRNRSKGWIATMRLIRAPLAVLPVFSHSRIESHVVPEEAWGNVAEFSRLCVVTKYRKTRGHARPIVHPEDSFLRANYRSSESWIFMGLARAAWDWSRQNGVRYWVFFVSEALGRIIHQSGFDLEPLGAVVDYRGPRRPYLVDLCHAADHQEARAPKVHAMFGRRPAFRRFSDLAMSSRGVRRHLR